MITAIKKTNVCTYKVLYLTALFGVLLFNFSCSKQETLKQSINAADSTPLQINFLAKIKSSLKDSLSVNDFMATDFSKLYKSKDVRSKNYFLRLCFKGKKISDGFILLKTDSLGNVLKGKIVEVKTIGTLKSAEGITLIASSLDRKEQKVFKNEDIGHSFTSHKQNNRVTSADESSLKEEEEEPVGEQTLPEVVVIGYIYDYCYYWYCFDDLLGMNMGGGTTYSYGSSETYEGDGGGDIIYPDDVIDITYEDGNKRPIDVTKYINCFSLVSNNGATFKISIYSDIPVNSDSYQLFDYSTGACGHTFLQLTKSNGGTVIQQNIGFYPQSGWKSIEANGPVNSKLVDNAGHEFNASLTVSVDATHFQNALNEIQYYGKLKYDIDNFNCTDFALNVFNSAASLYLEIPQYHIPGGMIGEFSNTPQGLYNELSSLSKSGGYPDGQITIPGVAGYTGSSHGACN